MKKPVAKSAPAKMPEDRWQAEDDVRILQKAGEIERDRARLARAKATAKKQAQDLARITARKR